MDSFNEIQSLLQDKADIQARIKLIPYDGNPEEIEIAINLCMYCMKTQIFIDGNKRASVIFANHYLISHGQGFLGIPEEHVPEFKRKLVDFYEGENIEVISDFIIA